MHCFSREAPLACRPRGQAGLGAAGGRGSEFVALRRGDAKGGNRIDPNAKLG